jgi:hypothetical protein
MYLSRFVSLAVTVLWSCAASAQSQQWVTIGKNARAFHEAELRGLNIQVEPTVVRDVEILIELIGLPNTAKINALSLQIRRSVGIKNAFGFEQGGFSTVVYDPDWAARVPAEFYLVLGHELGHFFCGHYANNSGGDSLRAELEADRFDGASIKRFEVYHNRSFFGAVSVAARAKYDEQASTLYPSRTARLEALAKGYEQGSPCGGLVPVLESGLSRGPR